MDIKKIRMKAFLMLIRYAEHKREDDGVYLTMYGGGTFTDTSKHPNKLIKKWGKKSTAAGAYQIIKKTWDGALYQGIADDFSPTSQDKIAIFLIKSKNALSHVEAGEVEQAISHVNEIWAALPGGSQKAISMDAAKKRFALYVQMYSEQAK